MPSRRGRPFMIKPDDVRLYYESMYAVVTSMEWPWTERGVPGLEEPPERDDDLPTAEGLMHKMDTYLNPEALNAVKARARKVRHRQKKKPVCLHLEYDTWALLKECAQEKNMTLSQAVRELLHNRAADKAE